MKLGSKPLAVLKSEQAQAVAGLTLETSFLAFVALFFFSRKAADVALILLALSWMVRRFGCSPFFPSSRLRLPLLFFLISMLLSALFAEERSHSLTQLYSQVPKILVIFLGSWEYLRDEEQYRRLFWVSTWVILLIGVDGLAQLVQGHDWIRGSELWRGRVTAHFASPTFFAYPFPLLAFPLSLWGERIGWWKRAGVGLAMLTFLLSSFATRTRSVWIALALVLLFLFLSSSHKIPYLIGIGFVALALAVLPISKARERLFSAANFLSEQRYQRILAWQISYRMFLSRPLLGKGLDFFDRYQRNEALQRPYLSPLLYEKLRKGGKGVVFPIYHPHSIYLELLASQGVVGMAAFLSILAVLIHSLWKGKRSPPLPFLGTSAALLSFLVLGAVGTSFYHPWSYGIFWLLAGMGMSLRGEE